MKSSGVDGAIVSNAGPSSSPELSGASASSKLRSFLAGAIDLAEVVGPSSIISGDCASIEPFGALALPGANASPELRSSAMARCGFILFSSHNLGRKTPVVFKCNIFELGSRFDSVYLNITYLLRRQD